MSEPDDLWTTGDVARYLGVRVGTVSAYRVRGQMPPPLRTVGLRTHLWSANTIREWQTARTTPIKRASDYGQPEGEARWAYLLICWHWAPVVNLATGNPALGHGDITTCVECPGRQVVEVAHVALVVSRVAS